MASKSFSQITTDMRNFLRSQDATIDTSVGSIMSDVVIEPPAQEIEDIYVENEKVSFLQSLFNYELMSEAELDRYVFNFGIKRNGAINSTGQFTFQKATAPDEDIVIPQGTVVSTKKNVTDPAITFITTEEVILLQALANDFFNPDTGFFEITANIQAEVGGLDGDVSSGSITVLQSSVPGITGGVNKLATSGGLDKESQKSLSDRGLLALTGNNVGTESGYISTLLANPFVNDALLVGPSDELMTRDNGFGGKVDLYITASLENSNTFKSQEEFYAFQDESAGNGATDPANNRPFDKQPVKSVTSVTGSEFGAFTEGVHFKFLETPTTNALHGSTRAIDSLQWLTNDVQAGETVTIVYQYYNLMEDLDVLLEDNRTVTADILVKLAIGIGINSNVVVFADETITDEGREAFQNEIASQIALANTRTSLSGVIQQSDVTNVINTVSGVDRIRLPFNELNAPDKPEFATGVNDEIVLAANEFSQSGTNIITAILVTDSVVTE